MPTLKQKKLAKEIVENLESSEPKSAGEILESIGYSKAIAKNPKMAIEGKGVQEELEVLGFSEEAAKGVVASILHHSDNDMARLKASDQMFKVLGSYAPEKRENVNLNLNSNITPKSQALAKQYEEEMRKEIEGEGV